MDVQAGHEQEPKDIFDDHNEILRYNYGISIRKTKNKLLTIAFLFFLSDLLGLIRIDMFTFQMFIWILLLPAILAGLAFLALKEPLAAVIIATILIAALWIYTIAIVETGELYRGILVRIIIIVLLVTAFKAAIEATRIKKELPKA